MSHLLPADIIIVISRSLSAVDFFHFGLVSKRHHSILLRHISDPCNRQSQLLDLFTQEILTLTPSSASLANELPNGSKHGRQQLWDFTNRMDLLTGQLQMKVKKAVKFPVAKKQNILQNIQEFGVPMFDGTFFFGKRHGKCVEFARAKKSKDIQVVKHREISYENGIKHGDDITFFANGQVNELTHFKKGLREGTQWIYQQDYDQYTWQEVHFLQCKTEFKEDREHGIKENWEGEFLTRSEHYYGGELHGETQIFEILDGNCSAIKLRVNFQNNFHHGKYEKFSPSSGLLLASCSYDNGNQEGDSLTWYESGIIETRYYYQNGRREGQNESYWPSGLLRARLYWNAGELDESRSEIYNEKRKRMFTKPTSTPISFAKANSFSATTQ